jgi:tetratricopeptide (TPR) repeat protein
MKRYFLSAVFLIASTAAALASVADSVSVSDATGVSGVSSVSASDVSEDEPDLAAIWDRANTDYVNGNYAGSIVRYDSIAVMDVESSRLYYNLGNAHFKAGHIGLSILNYHRALRLAPSNGDIKYNLAIADSYVKDNIERVPEFFVVKWFRAVRMLLGGDGWAWASIVALAAALALTLVYLLASGLFRRKSGFYGAILLFALAICSAIFASIDRVGSSQAVVVEGAVPVKSSPGETSKEIFVIHEGTTVEILDRLDDWREIVIADGNKGWVRATAITVI